MQVQRGVTYQCEDEEENPREESVGEVENQEMEECGIVCLLCERAEVSPATRAEWERGLAARKARRVSGELRGERSLLRVVVTGDWAVELCAVRIIVLAVAVAAIGVEVVVASGLEGGKDSVCEGGG